MLKKYKEEGFFVSRAILETELIDKILSHYLSLVNTHILERETFKDPHENLLVEFFKKNRKTLSSVYDEIRFHPWLEQFVLESQIIKIVNNIFVEGNISTNGGDALKKIIMRMDMPNEISELAVWHQDFFYVKGNTEVITAWIPLQDTCFEHGCLSIMPGSHKLGPIAHDKKLLKKKYFPSQIFNNDFKYVEMKKGDVLFFNALLLHAGNINISDAPRYSIQVRFSPFGFPVPPEMNGFMNVTGEM